MTVEHWTAREYRPIEGGHLVEWTIVYARLGDTIRSMEFPAVPIPQAVLGLAQKMNEHALRQEDVA